MMLIKEMSAQIIRLCPIILQLIAQDYTPA